MSFILRADINHMTSIIFLFSLQNLQQIQNFGEPFFLVIHEGETLAEIKVRIQKKLQVPDDEFGKVFTHTSSYFCNFVCLTV